MSERTQYWRRMFGDRQGFVAVACKRGENSWDERTFHWPDKRADLITWVRDNVETGNIFICPSLRGTAARAKADMADGGQQWLWADVDWAKITNPQARSRARARIEELGTYVVASGTGKNVHVYVRLAAPVDADEHLRLNTGLREYLYADFKQADNSLLRLPGTFNRKTDPGTPVVHTSGHDRAVTVNALLAIPTFKRVAVTKAIEANDEWDTVPVPDLPAKMRRAVKMSADEGIGRYGSRHKAIWAVTGDLMKHGLTPDQVHTIMDAFPPGTEKEAEERGFNLHRDVARRIAMYAQTVQNVTQQLAAGRVDDDDTSAFEDISDDDVAAMGTTNPLVRKERERRAAMREVDNLEAQEMFMPPPDESSWNAADALASPPEPRRYLIEGLAGVKHNVVITAQYKTGKTAFCIATLARSLVDGVPFAGEITVDESGVIVGHWNLEMDDTELLDDYIRPSGLINTKRLEILNGRGYGINILTHTGKQWTINWLRERHVQVWTIDSLARVLRMCGVKEQENDAVLNVLMAIDEIKVAAGVDVSFIIAHTGRAEMAEGAERARGATVIDDWADARWIMTKDGVGSDAPRFLAVEGRGVSMRPTSLKFDEDTHISVLGTVGKNEDRAARGVQGVLSLVVDNPGVGKTALKKMMMSNGVPARACDELVAEAIECGFIETKRIVNGKGGKPTQAHYPVTASKPNGGGATPRAVDMTSNGRYGRRGL